MSAPESPQLLFVCVHNAGRSQMAAAYARALSGGRLRVRSAGSKPSQRINPTVRAAMTEEGVYIADARPRKLSDSLVESSDVIITMGCGEECTIRPGQRREDWDIPDPAGRCLLETRTIRDEIRERVRQLLARMGLAPSMERESSRTSPGVGPV